MKMLLAASTMSSTNVSTAFAGSMRMFLIGLLAASGHVDFVPKLGVRLESLLVHAGEHGYRQVDVVEYLNPLFAVVVSMQPACLLRYAAIPGYRRRNKQVVEICKVEPLAQEAFGGNNDSVLVLKAGKLAQYRFPLFSIDFPG